MSGLPEKRLSVIIPTVGRPGLLRAIDSCAEADEVIVVLDKAANLTAWPEEMRARQIQPNVKIFECIGGDHGYTARTKGIAEATGTHLCFLDDDDVYTEGAIERFRESACEVPVIFRMDHYAHGILWREPKLEFGNVSTQMFVVPNEPEKMGVWAPHAPGLAEPGGDFTFLRGCAERMGSPVWREEIVAQLRPDFLTITVVTPWYNHPELADAYVEAMKGLAPRDECIVVDGSDFDAREVEEQLLRSNRISISASSENLGFTRGSNYGLEHAATGAVLFLNNDIRTNGPGWVERIREALEPGVLVGAQLRYDRHADVDGQNLPYLDGWCLAGMRGDLEELGGFEEELEDPGYFSDNLLCLRARAAGMSLREVNTGLVHLNGVTSGASRGVDHSASTLANYEYYAREARSLFQEAAAV